MGAIYDATTKLIFGLADVTFGASPLPLLAQAVTFNAEPSYTDISVYDFGEGAVDRIVTGWNVTVQTAFAEESIEAIELAIPVTKTSSTLHDSPVGESLRTKGQELVIHPRQAGVDTTTDIKVFKAVPSGSFERVYGMEQGSIAVTFTGLVKDGAEAGKAGNYFQFGPDVIV